MSNSNLNKYFNSPPVAAPPGPAKDWIYVRGLVDFSNESYASVLRFEETFALVDYYETYLYIASTDASVNAVPNPLFDGIDLLEKEIPDQRLTKRNSPPAARTSPHRPNTTLSKAGTRWQAPPRGEDGGER